MKVLPHLRQSQHRHRQSSRKHVERDKLTDRERAFDDKLRAEIEGERRDQLADELYRLARSIAEADDLEAGTDIASQLLFPAPLHLRLNRHRFECLDAVDALDEKRLVF